MPNICTSFLSPSSQYHNWHRAKCAPALNVWCSFSRQGCGRLRNRPNQSLSSKIDFLQPFRSIDCVLQFENCSSFLLVSSIESSHRLHGLATGGRPSGMALNTLLSICWLLGRHRTNTTVVNLAECFSIHWPSVNFVKETVELGTDNIPFFFFWSIEIDKLLKYWETSVSNDSHNGFLKFIVAAFLALKIVCGGR